MTATPGRPWTRPPTVITIPKPGSTPVNKPNKRKTRRKENRFKKAQRRDPVGDTYTGTESEVSSVHTNSPKRSEHSIGGDAATVLSNQVNDTSKPTPDIQDEVVPYCDDNAAFEREKTEDTSPNHKINARKEDQTAAPAPIEMKLTEMSHSQFKSIFAWKTDTLPSYTGSRVNHGDSRPVSFPEQFSMAELFTPGHERALQDCVYELLPSWKKRKDEISIFYFPGRHFFVDDQHAVVMGPATQESTEHGFKLTSRFEKIYGQTRPFFYAVGPFKNKQVFYAGTYQCIKLADDYPQGFVYSGGNLVVRDLAEEIIESQTEGFRLRTRDAIQFLRENKIMLEFVMLQLIDFQMDVYQILTSASMKNAESTRKRKRESGA